MSTVLKLHAHSIVLALVVATLLVLFSA